MPGKPLKLRMITLLVAGATICSIAYAVGALRLHSFSWAAENSQLLLLSIIFGLGAVVGLLRVEAWGLIVTWAYGLGWIAYGLQNLMAPSRDALLHLVALFAAVLVLMVVSQDRVRKLFFDKNLRWWQRPKRHAIDLPISITVGSVTFSGKLLNVSSEGCLAGVELELRDGECLDINFESNGHRFHSVVKVVRKSSAPHGFGMVFIEKNAAHARQLRRIQKQLKRTEMPLE